ncbi:MAG: hypothetical protein ACOX5A_07950 [Aminivibrio sp.]|jgi:hypothetical protein
MSRVMLQTSYNGRPAPGGIYNPKTGHYVKACKNPAAGKHPYRLSFGGIDDLILEELKRLGCRTMTLKLGDGATYHTDFNTFKENAFPIRWKDPRFTGGPRWYLDGQHWANEGGAQDEALRVQREADKRRQEVEAIRSEQMVLFSDEGKSYWKTRLRWEQGP